MILEPKKMKSVSTYSPSLCHQWWDWMPWSSFFECWVLNQLFPTPLSLSSFSSSRGFFGPLHFLLLKWYHLRLSVFLMAILIPACDSSSPASAYKVNKQGDSILLWHTPFPILNPSIVLCPVLTVASWPDYRFLRRKVRLSGIPISWWIFLGLLWST